MTVNPTVFRVSYPERWRRCTFARSAPRRPRALAAPSSLLGPDGRARLGHAGYKAALEQFFRKLGKLDLENAAFSIENADRVRKAVKRVRLSRAHDCAQLEAPFGDGELEAALKTLRNSAPGIDGISNEMLKHCFTSAETRRRCCCPRHRLTRARAARS